MKNTIIALLVTLLAASVYINIADKKTTVPTYVYQDMKKEDFNNEVVPKIVIPASSKITLAAKANYQDGHIVGGNTQKFDVTIVSDTDIGQAKVIFTQNSSAVVPNAVVHTVYTNKDITIRKGTTIIEKVPLAVITKVTVNGISIPFTQSYDE